MSIKISQLPAGSIVTGTEIDPAVQSGVTVSLTANQRALFSQGGFQFTDSGVANAYVLASAKPLQALNPGQVITFIPLHPNTGASTANAAGSGAQPIIDALGNALTGGEIVGPVAISWTGTQWQLLWTLPFANKRTTAEISTGVVPVNYSFSPNHIGADVRRYGNIDLTGAVDCRAILALANTTGMSLYFPTGIYRISSNLTLSSPSLIFESGAVLTPDANITVTVNSNIQANISQIFNISNANSVITGLIQNDHAYAEWFGAIGNNIANDGPAIQAAINLCAASNFIPLYLMPKTYRTTQQLFGAPGGGQSFSQVSLLGTSIGGNTAGIMTTINAAGAFGALTSILRYRGGSGGDSHAEVSHIFFEGDSNAIGIEFMGATNIRAVQCKFQNLAEGVRWNNADAGSFTEYCILDNCEILSGVTLKGHYVIGAGNVSFHGSGFWNRTILQHTGAGPIVLIDSGCHPYNAALDCQVFISQNCTFIRNNNATGAAGSNCYIGNLTCETGSLVLTLADTNPIFFSGSISINGQNSIAGTFLQARAIVLNPSGQAAPLGAEQSNMQALTTGANTLLSHPYLAAQPRHMFLVLLATNYEYVYDIIVWPSGTGVTVVQGPAGGAPQIIFFTNVAGYGAPTISASGASGNVVVTNAGFPASGVTAIWMERAVWSGLSNSAQGFV